MICDYFGLHLSWKPVTWGNPMYYFVANDGGSVIFVASCRIPTL
jgi:hypothetical protein